MNTCFQLTKLTIACAACLGLIISSTNADDTTEHAMPEPLAELMSRDYGQIWSIDAEGNRKELLGHWSNYKGWMRIYSPENGYQLWDCHGYFCWSSGVRVTINFNEEVPQGCMSDDTAWFEIARRDDEHGFILGDPIVIGFSRDAEASPCPEGFELDATLDEFSIRFVAYELAE
jgi:hypothetical protein